MITMVFLLLLLLVALFLAATGAGTAVGLTELAVLSLVFIVFFLSGIYVAAALGMLALLADVSFASRPIHPFIGQVAWNASINFVLVAVPLFLLMGEILLRSGLSDRLYRALNTWFGGLPGGLLHTNIVACSIFSAVSGSSVATAATIGAVALPYFDRTGYSPRLVLGSLAAGGALGNLIPPGITFIVYGLLTDTSVGKLYAAGFVAGFIVAALFMLFIFAYSLVRTSDEARSVIAWSVRFKSLLDLLPTMLLIVLVLGTIYAGVATPTEAAALGVVGAVALAAVSRRLTLPMLHASARATARTTSMIGLIILSAFALNFVLSRLRLPQTLATMVTELALPAWVVMAIIIVFYIALGTFMEGFSMMITTLPVVFPIVTALGYDAVWFGVILTMLVEIALISPPDGMVMYVLQGMRTRPGPITDVFTGVLPFLGIYALGILLLMAFPRLVLWLPALMVR
jgi:tripartite ATP-independent transporter DctM subunit